MRQVGVKNTKVGIAIFRKLKTVGSQQRGVQYLNKDWGGYPVGRVFLRRLSLQAILEKKER